MYLFQKPSELAKILLEKKKERKLRKIYLATDVVCGVGRGEMKTLVLTVILIAL